MMLDEGEELFGSELKQHAAELRQVLDDGVAAIEYRGSTARRLKSSISWP